MTPEAMDTREAVHQNRHFQCRTLEEARTLATHLAQAFPDPQRVEYGLAELLINAVEHGNLAITYEEKTQLLQGDVWHDEITQRLALEEYKHRIVRVDLYSASDRVWVHITDEGQGFDWKKYDDVPVEATPYMHGRGILTSKSLSFDALEYRGRGNEVVAIVYR